jgi:flagellar protein FlbD
MINVTRFNDKKFVLNAELIESIEENPDTVITLTNGHKYLVKETLDEVLDLVYDYKNKIFSAVINVNNSNY